MGQLHRKDAEPTTAWAKGASAQASCKETRGTDSPFSGAEVRVPGVKSAWEGSGGEKLTEGVQVGHDPLYHRGGGLHTSAPQDVRW